jgi:hypothetical protein
MRQQQRFPQSACMSGIQSDIFSIFLPQSTGKPVASMKKKSSLSDCRQRPAFQRNTKSQTSQLKIIATRAEAPV